MNLFAVWRVLPATNMLKWGDMTKHQAEKGHQMRALASDFDPVAAALQQLHQVVASEELPEDFRKILDAIDARLAEARTGPRP